MEDSTNITYSNEPVDNYTSDEPIKEIVKPSSPTTLKAQEALSSPYSLPRRIWNSTTSFVSQGWNSTTTKVNDLGQINADPTDPHEMQALVKKAHDLEISETKIVRALERGTLAQSVRLREKTLKYTSKILKNFEVQANHRLAQKTGGETNLTLKLLEKVVKTALKNDISKEGQVLHAGGQIFLAKREKGNLKITQFTSSRFLGGGSFGQVYRELHVSSGTTVALKVAIAMGPGSISQKEAKDALHHEAKILQMLNKGRSHTTGVQPAPYAVYNITGASNMPGFAMPLFDQTLQDFVDKRERNLSKNKTFSYQLFAGLKHVHDNGIVHNDIKPQNIGIKDGEAFLCDFGCSRSIDKLLESGFNRAMQWGVEAFHYFVGINHNESSAWSCRFDQEAFQSAVLTQNKVKASEIAEKGDVFTLGAVTYYLLSQGKTPWDWNEGPPDAPFDSNFEEELLERSGLSAAGITILRRTLDSDYSNRPTAAEVAAILAEPIN